MTEIRDKVQNRAVNPIVSNNAVTECIGIVMKANERENICDVSYINSSGKYDRKENIEYRIKNKKDEWFPAEQDRVILHESNDNQPVIVNELVDYTKDWKKDRYVKKTDVFASNDFGCSSMTD